MSQYKRAEFPAADRPKGFSQYSSQPIEKDSFDECDDSAFAGIDQKGQDEVQFQYECKSWSKRARGQRDSYDDGDDSAFFGPSTIEITPKKLVICGHKLSPLCAEEYDLEVLSKPIEGRDNETDMLHINCVIAEILDAGGAGVLWGGHVIGCLRRRLLDRWECIENAMIAQNHDGPRSVKSLYT
ncbi:hypothetical protein niasHT_016068 [Heterodera trifolii]|uniref:Uncharacterized protein n=1 Tax=Heterodera trifolii TaxID=157864 RepID=A0ABD2LAT6_9BILA